MYVCMSAYISIYCSIAGVLDVTVHVDVYIGMHGDIYVVCAYARTYVCMYVSSLCVEA